MKKITCLFLDIGNVLLTNGWGHESRFLAVDKFKLNKAEMEDRHKLTFDTYELGKISLDEYLDRCVFYEKRDFTHEDFKKFMFDQSKKLPGMKENMILLKNKYNLKIAVVSNEGRELNEYRIRKFKLKELVDFFISSCFVHFRKPDADIFQMALDVAQVNKKEIVYIDDRQMFVDIAKSLGLKGIHHVSMEDTFEKLAKMGLPL